MHAYCCIRGTYSTNEGASLVACVLLESSKDEGCIHMLHSKLLTTTEGKFRV